MFLEQLEAIGVIDVWVVIIHIDFAISDKALGLVGLRSVSKSRSSRWFLTEVEYVKDFKKFCPCGNPS